MAKENQESSRKKWADFVEDVTNALFQIIFDPDNKFTKAEDSRMELIFNKYFEKLEEKAQADRRDNIKITVSICALAVAVMTLIIKLI